MTLWKVLWILCSDRDALGWLDAVYRLRKVYRDPRLLFSERKEILEAARPLVGTYFTSTDVVAYPDAFFFIKSEDATRTELNLEHFLERHKHQAMEEDQ